MSAVWEQLLASDQERVLPWTGLRKVHSGARAWRIVGELPAEHGWYRFRTGAGRDAVVLGPSDPDPSFEDAHPVVRGYLTGNRIIPDDARVELDPSRLIQQTERVFLVEPGLERFCRAVAARGGDDRLVFVRQEFPQGPEDDVNAAFQERRASVDHIAGVTPPLDLAFRWLVWLRDEAESRARRHEQWLLEQERLAAEAAQRAESEARSHALLRATGTGESRRDLAARDFEAAARQALHISGAELLDARPAYGRGEMIVQYRFRAHRLECVVDRATLRVTDSGVCLTDEATGERGDTYFTLESLPAVIGEAIDQDALVIYRHP